MKQSDIKRLRPELFKENIFYANEYLNNHGPLTGLQLAVNQDYFDFHYGSEKVRAVIRTMEGIQHNMNIIYEMQQRDMTMEEKTWMIHILAKENIEHSPVATEGEQR